MDNQFKQTFEAKIKHYQFRLEDIQDEQSRNRKEQQSAEEWHDRLSQLRKEEQELYQESMFECDNEERVFFEVRSGDSENLSKKAFYELEERHHELEKEKKRLIEKEDQVLSEQRLALAETSGEQPHGT